MKEPEKPEKRKIGRYVEEPNKSYKRGYNKAIYDYNRYHTAVLDGVKKEMEAGRKIIEVKDAVAIIAKWRK